MNPIRYRSLPAALFLLFATHSLSAQAAPAPAATAAPATSPFSGLIFGNFNYLVPTTPQPLAGQLNNAFTLDRAYLTFRMPAGENMSIRITTDIYQTTESTPNAYTVRAKYAYFQYDVPKFSDGGSMFARVGIMQNVVIEFIESFWPRWVSQTAVERAGYFASADMGLAAQYNLPKKLGEVYATVSNGPGYTTRERDRFKDYAIRFSLSPLANHAEIPLLQTFTVTAWGYKGANASSFVAAGDGTALDRSRAGVFVGIKDPRLVIGGEYSQRHDEGEQGVAALHNTTATTGHLLSAFTIARPLAFTHPSGKSRVGLLARYDAVTPAASTSGFVSPSAPITDNAYHVFIGGLMYDLNARAQVSANYQEVLNASNSLGVAPPTQAKTYFAQFVVNF